MKNPHSHVRRTPLSHLGSSIVAHGDPQDAGVLQEVFHDLDQRPWNDLTHGFHTYPARLHPLLVRRILRRFERPPRRVLDPFAGGGTTLVEAMAFGCEAFGCDINPIALRIARARSRLWNRRRRRSFLQCAGRISEAAFEDARARRPRTLSPAALRDRSWYLPHVLHELQGLADRIRAIEDEAFREMAWMVFSSLLVKVSLQRSDTRLERVDKSIGRGTTSRLFGRRAEALARGLGALHRVVPRGTPEACLIQADARALPGDAESIDVIVTSPPYPGILNYASHQARRCAWLEEEPSSFEPLEIGGRVSGRSSADAWLSDQEAFLGEMARVLRPGAHAFVVLGDGIIDGRPHRVDRSLPGAAKKVGLRARAWVSRSHRRRRPHVGDPFGDSPRFEHLFMLRKE